MLLVIVENAACNGIVTIRLMENIQMRMWTNIEESVKVAYAVLYTKHQLIRIEITDPYRLYQVNVLLLMLTLIRLHQRVATITAAYSRI